MPVAVDVRVLWCRPAVVGDKDDLGRFERIVVWKSEAEGKRLACVDCIGAQDREGKAPLAQVFCGKQCCTGRWT